MARVVHERGIRAIVCEPPRHGKSQLVSRWGMTYALDVDPTLEIMLTAYGADLAEEWSRQIRGDLEHPDHTAKVSPLSSAVGRWHTTAGGGVVASGIGGSLTGRGADIAVIDDPIKTRADAESPAYRARVWDWFTSTLFTRLSPTASVIVCLTRWHHDDLAGRLLEQDRRGVGEGWEVYSYPAIAEEGDPLGRAPGEALWPEQYSVEYLARLRRTIGERDWASLYMQTPHVGGASFWPMPIPCYRDRPKPERFRAHVVSIDTNLKGGPGTDPVSALIFGVERGADRLWLLDEVHTTSGFEQMCLELETKLAAYPLPSNIIVEAKALGESLVTWLKRKSLARRVIAWDPGPHGSKEARATAGGILVETGHLLVPAPEIAPWVVDYVQELAQFPVGRHDDRSDATAQVLIAAFVERRLQLGGVPGMGGSVDRLGGSSRIRG